MAKNLELPGALPPGPPPEALPLDPTGALKRAPGPHAVRCSARYARFALMDTTLWPPQSLLPCYAPALPPITLIIRQLTLFSIVSERDV